MSPVDKIDFSFRNKFYLSTVLLIGNSPSVSIFESFTQALPRMLLNKLGVSSVSHIISDFIIVGPVLSQNVKPRLRFFSNCQKMLFQSNTTKHLDAQICGNSRHYHYHRNTFSSSPKGKIMILNFPSF